MEIAAMLHGQIDFVNIGDTNLTIDGHELNVGESLPFSVFKGIDLVGEVRTGNRSFKIKIVDPVVPSVKDLD